MPDVAVIFGGPSPEHDVSVLTGLQAARALISDETAAVRALYWSKTGEWYLVDPALEASAFVEGVPRGAEAVRLVLGPGGGFESGARFGRSRPVPIEAAVVCCHGGPGENGMLQAALDLAGISYSGPTVAGAALGMDKLAFGTLMAATGLPTLPRAALDTDTTDVGFDGPYIVKPRFGGSSLGIEIAADLETCRALARSSVHLRDGAVVEPYRADLTDLNIGVRTWPGLELSAIERPLRTPRAAGAAGEPAILDYADKYAGGEGMASAPRELPAAIEPELAGRLRAAAEHVAHLSLVRGLARIDFLSDGSELFVNEVNTIPGSLARYLWIDPEVPFATLLSDLLTEARDGPRWQPNAAGADGMVLRGAGSIAAKLA